MSEQWSQYNGPGPVLLCAIKRPKTARARKHRYHVKFTRIQFSYKAPHRLHPRYASLPNGSPVLVLGVSQPTIFSDVYVRYQYQP